MRKFLIALLIPSLFLLSACAPQKPATTATAEPSDGYRVYKSDGSIVTLVPSPEHPLVFFATWCSHCQKDLADRQDPNAYYIDTFAKEASLQDSFKAIKDFIQTYHADPDLNRYFVSVDKRPKGVPHVPITLTHSVDN